jgi:hypothetical protein
VYEGMREIRNFSLRTSKHRWKDKIKMDHKDTECDGVV